MFSGLPLGQHTVVLQSTAPSTNTFVDLDKVVVSVWVSLSEASSTPPSFATITHSSTSSPSLTSSPSPTSSSPSTSAYVCSPHSLVFLILNSVSTQHSGLSGGAIAGIAVGVSVWLALVIVGAALFLYRRRGSAKTSRRPRPERDITPFPPPPPNAPAGGGLVPNR
jgi:hypothetical protein